MGVQRRRSDLQLLLSRRGNLGHQRSWSSRVNSGVVYQIEQEFYIFAVGALKLNANTRTQFVTCVKGLAM